MRPHIEPATTDDCHAIAEVHVLSWRHAYQNLLPAEFLASLSVEQRAAMWRESLATGTLQLLVARDHKGIAGFIAFGPSRDEEAAPHSAEVWAIYLVPSSWSQGTGRMLWLAALERMLGQGYKTVSLWVIAGNERAIQFYSTAGFKPEPHSVRELTMGGVQLHEVRYVFNVEG
jgi:L-amino acid N-acyltransferase YncA